MTTATNDPVRLPPGPRAPKAVQGLALLAARHGAFEMLARRYGDAFTVNVPVFGRMVVLSSPADVKELFSSSREIVGRPTNNLGDVLGSGSTFALDGDELHERRRLLLPPFHGKGMRTYERITEEEVLAEIATWPEGEEFATLEPMMRISLNTILRAVFGAEGAALEELRTLMPVAVEFGSRIALMPDAVRRDFGPWSPGGRFAGQLFGDRDTWAALPDRTHHTRIQAEKLLLGMDVEMFKEDEKDAADSEGNDKHWHVYHIVAKNPTE